MLCIILKPPEYSRRHHENQGMRSWLPPLFKLRSIQWEQPISFTYILEYLNTLIWQKHSKEKNIILKSILQIWKETKIHRSRENIIYKDINDGNDHIFTYIKYSSYLIFLKILLVIYYRCITEIANGKHRKNR